MPVDTSKYCSDLPSADAAPKDLAFPKKLRSACNCCNEVKLRCTGTQPCSRCKSRNLECVYSYAARTGKPKGSKNKKTLERMRLRELEMEKQAEAQGRPGTADSRLCGEGSGYRESEYDRNVFSDSEDQNDESGAVSSVVMPLHAQPQTSSICLPEEPHPTIIIGSSWNSAHLPTPSNDGPEFGTCADRVPVTASASIGHTLTKSPAPTLSDKGPGAVEMNEDGATTLNPMTLTQSLHDETDQAIQVPSDVGVHDYDAFAETFDFDETMYESLLSPTFVSGSLPTTTMMQPKPQFPGIDDPMPHMSSEEYRGAEIESYEALLLSDTAWRERRTSNQSLSSSGDGINKNVKRPRYTERATAELCCLREQAEALERLKQAEKRHGEPHPEAVLTLTTQVLDSSKLLLECRQCAADYDFLYLCARTLRVAAQWLQTFLARPITSDSAGLTLSLGVHKLTSEESTLVRNLLISRAGEKAFTIVRMLREQCAALLAAQQADPFIRPWDLAYMRLTIERLEDDLRSLLKEAKG